MSEENKSEKSKKDEAKATDQEGPTLPDGTKLPPITDEAWEKFERKLPRNSRDKK